jgi:signal transduction histidine kinase
VKRYVELLDGTISFTSKENIGTSFTVEFPKNKKD